jgi:hypothetical protein
MLVLGPSPSTSLRAGKLGPYTELRLGTRNAAPGNPSLDGSSLAVGDQEAKAIELNRT